MDLLKFVLLFVHHFSILQVIAQNCLQAAGNDGNLPNFSSRDGSEGDSKITGGNQAIVPSYSFGCCGNITEWGTEVGQAGNNRQNQLYTISFQVWRPSPTVQNDGCYSLVGENRFTPSSFSDGLIRETPAPEERISYRPGDIVGFYVETLNLQKDGVVLDETYTSETVWYGNIEGVPVGGPNCPFPVGSQTNRLLRTSTNAAPVISVSSTTSSCTRLIMPSTSESSTSTQTTSTSTNTQTIPTSTLSPTPPPLSQTPTNSDSTTRNDAATLHTNTQDPTRAITDPSYVETTLSSDKGEEQTANVEAQVGIIIGIIAGLLAVTLIITTVIVGIIITIRTNKIKQVQRPPNDSYELQDNHSYMYITTTNWRELTSTAEELYATPAVLKGDHVFYKNLTDDSQTQPSGETETNQVAIYTEIDRERDLTDSMTTNTAYATPFTNPTSAHNHLGADRLQIFDDEAYNTIPMTTNTAYGSTSSVNQSTAQTSHNYDSALHCTAMNESGVKGFTVTPYAVSEKSEL